MAIVSTPISAVLRFGEGENNTMIMSLRNVRPNIDAPSIAHARAAVEHIRASMVDNSRLTVITEISDDAE